jgi:pyruvate/2-oxoacid:ferredoxin oxidoreductase alpha subunit
MDNAELAIVTLGSMSGTAKEAVDFLRDEGRAVGLVKVRLFRPFPYQQLLAALNGVATALVLDRNYSPGLGGILHQEVKGALYRTAEAPVVHGLLAGVGGVNVTPEKIRALVIEYTDREPAVESIWVD